jgi:hypothetical protein
MCEFIIFYAITYESLSLFDHEDLMPENRPFSMKQIIIMSCFPLTRKKILQKILYLD